MNNSITVNNSSPTTIARHLCPNCKSPMRIEEKSSSMCMGIQARVICSAKCGVTGNWQVCCAKSDFTGTPRQRAWKSWKAERKATKWHN